MTPSTGGSPITGMQTEGRAEVRIVITGAAGRIGRQMIRELENDHELVLLDRRVPCDSAWLQADFTRGPSRRTRGWLTAAFPWERHLEGADAILHLAGDPSPRASFADAMRGNVEATWNVLEAAARRGVPRLVHASSWRAARAELETRVAEPGAVSEPAAASPVSPYGLSKATAEEAGRMAVRAGRLDGFISVRIGSVVWQPPRPPEDPVSRRCAIGVADLRMLLRRSLERKLDGFHVIYGISPTPDAVVDLRATRRLLDWSPNDVPEDPRPRYRVTQTA